MKVHVVSVAAASKNRLMLWKLNMSIVECYRHIFFFSFLLVRPWFPDGKYECHALGSLKQRIKSYFQFIIDLMLNVYIFRILVIRSGPQHFLPDFLFFFNYFVSFHDPLKVSHFTTYARSWNFPLSPKSKTDGEGKWEITLHITFHLIFSSISKLWNFLLKEKAPIKGQVKENNVLPSLNIDHRLT